MNAAFAPFRVAETWGGRGRALVRVFGFVLLGTGLIFTLSIALTMIFGTTSFRQAPWVGCLSEWLTLGAFVLVTMVMAGTAGLPFGGYGLGGRYRIRNFFVGLAAGAALMALLVGVAWLSGGVAFSGWTGATLSATLSRALLYAAFFLAVGVFEEISVRGYLLVELSRAVSFWPAALCLGTGFGLLHLTNGSNETVWGALSAGLFGMIFAWLFRQTGSLWLSIGLHIGWDYSETFLFGLSNSGLALPGCLAKFVGLGPVWLSGGNAGPEGSALVLLPMAGMVLLGLFLSKRSPGVLSCRRHRAR